jgi:hypothetical protein
MTGYKPENPLIVQGDHTILAEVANRIDNDFSFTVHALGSVSDTDQCSS